MIFLYSKICYINHTEIEPKTIISWRRYISFANLQNLIMAIIGIITCNKPQHTQARTFPWSFCVLSVLCTVYYQYCVLSTVSTVYCLLSVLCTVYCQAMLENIVLWSYRMHFMVIENIVNGQLENVT